MAPQPDAAREVDAEASSAGIPVVPGVPHASPEVTAPRPPTPPPSELVPPGALVTWDDSAELGPPGLPGEQDEGGETRAAERSAARAAALAATEGFHPLRMRPYVAEPDGEAGETTVRPLLAPGDGGPETADVGLFAALYSGVEYAPRGDAEAGTPAAFAGAAAGTGLYQDRGRHRRRRRGLVVAAAAVAASALAAGAVAVTGQVMGDEPRTDRALPPDRTSSMPDVELPTESTAVVGTVAVGAPRHTPAPTTTSAAPVVPETATAPPSPSTTAPAATGSTPSAPAAPATTGSTPSAPTAPADPAPTTPPVTPTSPASKILQLGDTGAAVSDLQQRLRDVWVYHGHVNGSYDQGVREAVAMFQIWYGVRGDPIGVYGPQTRTTLEHQTS
ncbi:peptidoglycan-binding protein [Streptomyces sp. NPDC008079]|uniref:peptidoglycan-binding domain-containing protein n=1 Tax=Streptomyces sp. NPDC008079 TaxID=3364806 RepID=UPI0036E056C3